MNQFTILPNEMINYLFQFLDSNSMKRFNLTSKHSHEIVSDYFCQNYRYNYCLIEKDSDLIGKIRYLFDVNATNDLNNYKLLHKLKFNNNFNEYIPINSFPSNLKKIIFGILFNHNIAPGTFPDNIYKIKFAYYNKFIEKDVLPKNLKVLNLGYTFNQNINFSEFPQTIKKLSLSKSYKNPIITLPENLTIFIFHGYSNNLLNILPRNLIKLHLTEFNSEIECNILPSTLEILILNKFNQPLKQNSLPENLKELYLNNFNQELSYEMLPSNLKILGLGNVFNKTLDQKILFDSSIELRIESSIWKKS